MHDTKTVYFHTVLITIHTRRTAKYSRINYKIPIRATVTFTILGIFMCTGTECRYNWSLMRVCFLLNLISRWLWGTAQTDILSKLWIYTFQNQFGNILHQWWYVWPDSDLQSIWISLTFKFNLCTDVYNIYLQEDWTGVIIMEDMEHVIKLPSKGQISLWTDNDLKHIHLRDPYQIQILSRILDHIMDPKQNTGVDIRLSLMTASATHIANSMQDNKS